MLLYNNLNIQQPSRYEHRLHTVWTIKCHISKSIFFSMRFYFIRVIKTRVLIPKTDFSDKTCLKYQHRTILYGLRNPVQEVPLMKNSTIAKDIILCKLIHNFLICLYKL